MLLLVISGRLPKNGFFMITFDFCDVKTISKVISCCTRLDLQPGIGHSQSSFHTFHFVTQCDRRLNYRKIDFVALNEYHWDDVFEQIDANNMATRFRDTILNW